MYEFCENICIITGLIFVVGQIWELINRLLLFPVDRIKRYGGGWAVVTGGSDGIGLEFCNELARDGFNICIVGRNKDKINKVCEKLEKEFKVKTKMVIKDFKNCLAKPTFFKDII